MTAVNINGDVQVGAGNHGLGGTASDLHGLRRDDSVLLDHTMGGENTGVRQHPDTHEERTDQKRGASSPTVHPASC